MYVIFYITLYILLILSFKWMPISPQCLDPQKDIRAKKSRYPTVHFIMQGRLSQGTSEFFKTIWTKFISFGFKLLRQGHCTWLSAVTLHWSLSQHLPLQRSPLSVRKEWKSTFSTSGLLGSCKSQVWWLFLDVCRFLYAKKLTRQCHPLSQPRKHILSTRNPTQWSSDLFSQNVSRAKEIWVFQQHL